MQPPRTDHHAPWKERYRAPNTWTQLATANPQRGLAISNRSGVYQLYAWHVVTSELRQLTNRSTGIVQGVISPDGRWIYYLDDTAGNEIGHYVRIPFEGGAPEDITPDLPAYSSFSFTVSHDSNTLGLATANADGFHLYGIELEHDGTLGDTRPIFRSSALTFGPTFSHSGEIAIASSVEGMSGLDFKLLAFAMGTGEQIAELTDGPDTSVEMHLWSPVPGDFRAIATSNRSGVKRPLLWNPHTGERSNLVLDGIEGEVDPQDWSPDGNHVLLVHFNQARQQLYLYDLQDHRLHKLDHPGGTYGGVYFGPGGDIFAHWQDAVHPQQLIALDLHTGRQIRTVLPASEVPAGRPWRSITFPSPDGMPIQGWVSVPEGDGPFPTILETHGGPTAVMTEVFHPSAQAWLDHGYAFCSINYHGSTTFGRAFEQAIWGDLGNKEVEDMVGARNYLVEQGIADPAQILLTGWSYGGYLTLQALGKQPGLWAGGMAGIAIADWAIQYEDTADTLKGYQVALLGGTPQEKPEQYRASSPITYVEQVNAPVLVIQGSNDTRCPARPMHMYEARMRELGKPFEIHWFEAGHGSYVVKQSIEHQQIMLQWAYRLLSER